MIQLSRKTKPLGPRQRLAYVKPFKAAVAEAKAKVAAQEKAAADAEALRSKGLARLGQTAVAIRANPPLNPTLTSTIELKSWGLHLSSSSTPAEIKKARKALLAGEVAIECNGGSPKLPSLVRRFRAMAKPDVAKLRSLDRRINALQEQRRALIEGSFERGVPYTPDQLAKIIIGLATLPSRYYNGIGVDTWAVSRAESALREAEQHDGTKTCPCGRCSGLRTRAEQEARFAAEDKARQKARAKELARQPKLTFTCPECENVNEHAPIEIDDAGERYVTCEVCESDFGELELPALAKPAKGQKTLDGALAAA